MPKYISYNSLIGVSVIILLLASSCRKVNKHCNINAYANAPETTFFTSYGGSEEEAHGHFILTCTDGGYLQVGETGFIPNSAKILVVKTNASGDLLWKKEFGQAGNNLGNSAIELDDGYLICGAINENSTLIKLDKSTGATLFEKSYDNGGNDAFEHLTETANGLVAVGYTQAEDNSNTFHTEGEGHLVFLNHQGNKTNEMSLNDHLSHGYRVQLYNNELLIAGLTEGANDYGLMKLDSAGNLIWTKVFGGSDADHCFGMDLSDDGSIFLTGHTLSGTQNWDTYTIKVDNDGNQLWEVVQGNPRGFKPKYIHDEAWGIKAADDGGCIVVAGTGDEYGRYKRRCGNDGDNSNTWHVYLIKYTSTGSVEWQQTYGGGKGIDWAGEDIDLTSDGGAIVAVDNGKFGFLKIGPL